MLRLSPLKLAISKALYVPEWSVRVRRLIEQSGLNLLTDCSIPKLQHPIAQALSPCGHRPHMLCHFQENTPQCLSHSSSPFPMASARTRPCAASRPGSAAPRMSSRRGHRENASRKRDPPPGGRRQPPRGVSGFVCCQMQQTKTSSDGDGELLDRRRTSSTRPRARRLDPRAQASAPS